MSKTTELLWKCKTFVSDKPSSFNPPEKKELRLWSDIFSQVSRSKVYTVEYHKEWTSKKTLHANRFGMRNSCQIFWQSFGVLRSDIYQLVSFLHPPQLLSLSLSLPHSQSVSTKPITLQEHITWLIYLQNINNRIWRH